FFWGDPTLYVGRAHAAGVKVFHQVGSVAEAERAAAAGIDVIVAQGVEAGGHIAGGGSTFGLIPRVVEAGAPPPRVAARVVAAGGLGDGRGVVAVLALGAQAAMLGTRFLASAESRAHPHYKQRLLEADEGGTVRTILFGHGWPNAPHRTLRTAFVEQWLGQEARGQESRLDEPAVGQTVIGGRGMPGVRFMGVPPNGEARGGIGLVGFVAGPGGGVCRGVKPGGRKRSGRVRGGGRRRGRSSRGVWSAWYRPGEPAGRIPQGGWSHSHLFTRTALTGSGGVPCRRSYKGKSRSSPGATAASAWPPPGGSSRKAPTSSSPDAGRRNSMKR